MRFLILVLSLALAGPAVPHQQFRSLSPITGVALAASGLIATRLAFSGAARSTKSARSTVPDQWSGAYGDWTDYGHEIAVDEKDWNEFWHRVNQARPRALDAAVNMAVIVHLGERATGGFGIKVTGTYIEDGRLVIECAEVAPGPDRYVTQAFTRPWVIAVVPSTKLPIVFKTRLASAVEIDQ